MRHTSVKDFEKSLSGGEPSWKEGNISITNALNWYSYHSDSKDSKKFTISYLKEIKASKKDIELLEKLSDDDFQNLGFVCRIKLRGAQLEKKHLEWIDTFIQKLKEKASKVKTEKTVEVKTVSIQERVAEKSREYIGEIEGAIDECLITRNFKNTFNPYELMRGLEVKGAHTKFIIQHFSKQLKELEAVLSGEDKQLVEGYSFLKKSEIKEFANILRTIISDCSRITQISKVNRAPRKKKAKPVNKIVEKLQFKKEDSEFKVISINPTDIVGSSQLWVFNTKTRKLGCYNAIDVDGLNVKGTTLVNFNPESSIQKTIRKPEIVLPATIKAGKVALRKVLSDINAVEQNLTGRINSDTILLRIIK